jgi:hypothetical protein
MPSKKKSDRKLEEVRDLLAQGDENSLKAIEDFTEALSEYKKNEDSAVAKTLFERAKIRTDLTKRYYWEAIQKGIKDPRPSIKDPRPSPPLPEFLDSVGPEEIHLVPEVPDVS